MSQTCKQDTCKANKTFSDECTTDLCGASTTEFLFKFSKSLFYIAIDNRKIDIYQYLLVQ